MAEFLTEETSDSRNGEGKLYQRQKQLHWVVHMSDVVVAHGNGSDTYLWFVGQDVSLDSAAYCFAGSLIVLIDREHFFPNDPNTLGNQPPGTV